MSVNAAYIGEVMGYPKEQFRVTGFKAGGYVATRVVRVGWEYRYDWTDYFLDNTANWGYPYLMAAGISPNTIVSGVAIQPDTNSYIRCGTHGISEAKYEYALLTLVYQNCATSNEGEFLTEELLPASSQGLGFKGAYWGSGDKIDEAVPIFNGICS